MTDHPAIVALAEWIYALYPDYDEESEEIIGFHEFPPDEQAPYFDVARAAYAAVLKDLMEPSDELVKDWMTTHRGLEWYLRARAREIGVEVE